MEDVRYDVEVVQNMVYVFNKSMADPFNDWSDTAIAQGFSWREGCVGFLTFEDADPAVLDARFTIGSDASPADAERVIRVPFVVDAGGAVTISGIYEDADRTIAVPPGAYDLTCALSRTEQVATDDEDARLVGVFSFVSGSSPPAIVKADDQLDPPQDLAMDARTA